MIRAKMLVIFAGMIATLAVAAVPAFAEFQSNSSSTKGIFKTGALTFEGGGATLTCTSAEGTWTILSGGVPATKGTHENLFFEKFTGCKVKTSLITVTPTVFPCSLDAEQGAGKNTARVSVVEFCRFEVKSLGTCTVSLSGTGLEENALENVGSDLVITANDGGIASKFAGGGCIGVKETKEAKMKIITMLAAGQKWV